MTGRQRWGVLLPTFDPFGRAPLPVVAAARRAEELGFDAVWAGDHLLAHVPVLDSLTALGAAAAVTQRVEVGVSVLQLGLRPLAWTAKQLATVDALAPGRLRLGVGIGGEYPDELAAAGQRHDRRAKVTDEMLGLLPGLLRGEPVDHPGPLVPLRLPGLRPAVGRLPPVSVGGRRRAALRRTARFGDQWLPMWLDPATIRSSAEELRAMAAALDRPEPSVGLLILVHVDAERATARDGAAALVARQYRLPFEAVERWTACGPPARVAETLVAYREAGVGEVILMAAAADPLAQYERWAEVRRLVDGTAG